MSMRDEGKKVRKEEEEREGKGASGRDGACV